MKKEFDDLLCQRYPRIFAMRHGRIEETGMCWGFCCGDGWFALIDALCERLQFETDHNHAPQIVATQVKEKFGDLRFYVSRAPGATSERQSAMIDFAREFSTRLCEECGNAGLRLQAQGGDYVTRCAEHAPQGAEPANDDLRG